MNGFDETATAMSLAKQILMDCSGEGNITLDKGSLKIVLNAFLNSWHGEQDKKRSEYKKVAN